MKLFNKTFLMIVTALGILIISLGMHHESDKRVYTFNADGSLVRPEGYREWVFVRDATYS